ncbi:MAG: F0F1 ATP synthase subunit epsilon [Pseudomonadota bacterium]|nr:F0F1 ATP synthase subunit epsilon [Pseudomonadota bacterium]
MFVEIVSAEKEIFSGKATMLFAPAIEGEIGVAPGHTPMVSLLGPGEVRVQTGDEESSFYVSGGLIEIQPTVVTVLSDTAMRAEDLDEEAASQAKLQAEEALKNEASSMNYAKARAELAETVAQIKTIQRLRKKSGR